MRKLILTSKFKRSLKKFVQRNIALQQQVEKTLLQMTEDVFASNLMSHRLKGEYDGLRACSCGYDCRIIFTIEKNQQTNEDEIVLLNIGSHDEVY
ncbi:MAG: type II toxin-antitoxin system mRNA interferase toxin, RelE/StbE family [Pseudanabaena sp. CAN_BIN31]|nr:type II toxin-antitoxin system mRNA interferase toxin, RelE/StbE family [Pseudanabaena sp. CAN_BIN31]